MAEERISKVEGNLKEMIWNEVQKVQRVKKYRRKSKRHGRHSEVYPTFPWNPQGRGERKQGRSHI